VEKSAEKMYDSQDINGPRLGVMVSPRDNLGVPRPTNNDRGLLANLGVPDSSPEGSAANSPNSQLTDLNGGEPSTRPHQENVLAYDNTNYYEDNAVLF